jgi:hypothetical protein
LLERVLLVAGSVADPQRAMIHVEANSAYISRNNTYQYPFDPPGTKIKQAPVNDIIKKVVHHFTGARKPIPQNYPGQSK